jgi:streptogramin lyase
VGAGLVLSAAVGCGGSHNDDQALTVTRSALTAATDVFGFEDPGDWSTTTTGAVLTRSTTHSQGSFSLQVKPSNSNGFTPIASVPLSTLTSVSSTLAWDVMLPTRQPNPNWFGAAQMYLNCPSRNIFSAFLAQVELTGKPLNVWNTITFPLTNAQITNLLQTGYKDLTITVVINVPVPTTGVYLIDNLRFLPLAANACGGRPNGTSCTDGNACTLADTCQDGACKAGAPVVCRASDQCHSAGVCNSATGVCSNPQKAEGTGCDDGNKCTQTDTCQAGVCTGTSPVTCVASDACHVAGTCVPATGACTNPPAADGTTCDDQNACTRGDSCVAGTCVGSSSVVCTAPDGCHTAGTCDPATGLCAGQSPVADGTACDDGNACTQTDTCLAGSCVGGNPVVCAGPCQSASTCDPATGQCVEGPHGVVTDFPIPTPNTGAFEITAGPDGNVWFGENTTVGSTTSQGVGRISPAGVITEFPIPDTGSEINGLKTGPDGKIWMTRFGVSNQVSRISTTGVFEHVLSTADRQPCCVTPGPDSNMWFSLFHSVGIVTTSGVLSELAVPATTQVDTLVTGPDGAVWFVEENANRIGRITTAGAVTEFAIPTPNALPFDITSGADGNLWFTESGRPTQVGRITPSGVITEFPIPPLPIGGLGAIISGPDCNLWFTHNGGKIDRLTAAGALTEFPVSGFPNHLTFGSDGNIWFTSGSQSIRKMTP